MTITCLCVHCRSHDYHVSMCTVDHMTITCLCIHCRSRVHTTPGSRVGMCATRTDREIAASTSSLSSAAHSLQGELGKESNCTMFIYMHTALYVQCHCMWTLYISMCMYYMLMRDEEGRKEERSKQASKVKQTTKAKQHNTPKAHVYMYISPSLPLSLSLV